MELDPEIAAAMGFESFGKTKNDSKKRRVDAAFTELNANTFNPSASGSNAMPLGPRRKSGDSGTPETRPEAPGAVASPAGADAASTPLDETSANQGAESAAGTSPDPTAGMKASEARKFKKSKKNGDVPTGLGAFLNRGQQLPDLAQHPG
ncbi:L d-transpeptidase catalytic cell wall binding repeat [Neofusicoccum parvum]|uniref:L d-transpeptidase catalytic cell wall binding repeat n=1 Tax=Neofusicoccum parvum TaxID=310453 RepID=A0ACB5RUU2_9PEZI|nr:L d-transpeptidase catalytic cell wall binding repeat [Neofusicoccum parvum]